MSVLNIFHDFCRYPRWQIDNIEVSTASITVFGWAMPFHGKCTDTAILLNGNMSPTFSWNESPDLYALFPFIEGSAKCRFSAKYTLSHFTNILHFSYVGLNTGDPINRWTDIYFPISIWSEKKFVSPESAGLKRTQGHDSIFRYIMFGFSVAMQLDCALQVYFGTNLNNYHHICDWGVGCGRLAQMVHYLAPQSELFGIDVDSYNVDWCVNKLPFGHYDSIGLYPPTNILGETFDLVYGISVFSHLKFDAFEAWILELSRILRPGGVALVTIASGGSLVGTLTENPELAARVIRMGFDDGTRDESLDNFISDNNYYRSTFIMHEKATELFSKHFRVRDIIRQANAASQDLVVCERL